MISIVISFFSGCQTLTTEDGAKIRFVQNDFFSGEFGTGIADFAIKEKQTEEGWKKVELFLRKLSGDSSLKPYESFYSSRIRGEWYYGRRDTENPNRITLFSSEMRRLNQNEKGDSGGGGW